MCANNEDALAYRTNTIKNPTATQGASSLPEDSKAPVKQRQKKAYKDPSRWRCPHPDCNRSFAVLWRLKVHYRAPVDARGSGVERGHGMELSHCPKCGTEFEEGRHHVNCSAGRTAGPPNPKRTRKRSAESSGSEGTVVNKRPVQVSTSSTPSVEATSDLHASAALAQFLQALVAPPPPTLEEQLLSALLAVSAPAPADAAHALVSIKQPQAQPQPQPQEDALLSQLRSLLSAGGVANNM